MQLSEVYADVISKINLLQLAVNNLVTANTQSGGLNGSNLISSGNISALTAAMTTLQGNLVSLSNAIPAIVAGN